MFGSQYDKIFVAHAISGEAPHWTNVVCQA